MQNDKNTKIQELKNILKKFRDERGWLKFHDPKNLAEVISIEAGELQELFLWTDKKKIADRLKKDKKFRERVSEELADILMACVSFSNVTGLDISSIVREKVAKTKKKYPVKKAKGRSTKYSQL